MIIFVIQVSLAPLVIIAKVSTLAILSGMDKDVILAALFQTSAAIVHHGLSSICHHPQLIMLR